MSVAVVASYDQIGRKEDISDIITNISPTKTPFQSMVGSEGIHNIVHQWQEDSLIAAGANAAVEGADAPNAVQNATVLRSNTTQILTKTAKVTGTADVVKTYGRDKESAYQLLMRSKEVKRDLEFAMVGRTSGSVAGSDGVARKMGSYASLIDSGVVFWVTGAGTGSLGGSGGSAATVYEGAVRSLAQQLFTNGAEPNTLMVKPADSIVIADWQSGTGAGGAVARTKMFDNGQKNIVNVVDVFTTPWGNLKVVQNRFQVTSTALMFEAAMWKKLTLRNWFRQPLAKTGDSTNVQILGEFSLKHRNFKASGLIENLT